MIWRKIKGADVPFRYVSDDAVRARRAAARPVGRQGQARCSASRRPRPLDEMLDEVIPWIRQAVADGSI